MEVNTDNPVDYLVKINAIEKSLLEQFNDQIVPKLSTNFDINDLYIQNDSYIVERNQPLPKFLGHKILRIRGTSKTLSDEKRMKELFLMKDIISGLYGQRFPFFYLIIGKQNEISVNMGIQAEANDLKILISTLQSAITSIVTSLKGAYPGIELKILDNSEIKTLKDFLFKAENIGMLTGIPSPKTGTENIGIEQVERFIRGMYGDIWGYLVIAHPVPDDQVNKTFNDLVSEIKVTYPKIKESSTRNAAGQTITKENLDRSAQYYVELLESLLDRFKVGKSEGMWETSCYYFSPRTETFSKMGSLLKSTFSGERSFPEPVRTFRISDGTLLPKSLITSFGYVARGNRIDGAFSEMLSPAFTTVLTSEELSSLSCIPKEEMPGYDIRLSARYGVDLPVIIREDEAAGHKQGKIRIGMVKDRGENTHNVLSVNPRLFTKHCLVCGITGSGKTNTCFSLLEQMWNKEKIPFLVIEPTKGEYRNLIDVIPESRVFTLGNETIAPFRMNPFEVPEGVHVQRHLDNLKAIFNASFTMYPPMPFVLEHCLINIYEKNGWDLAMNLKGVTPTLEDLYSEVDVVVKGLGYHTEIASNVKAALKTRIRSLLLGGKGMMLNCEGSIPLEDILKHPTILELKGIGDDEEKAFLMGVLLGKLYEFREAKGNLDSLQHITLIEEAHRLLTNVSKGGEESNQAKAKAVETLCNILTEVRAYGEGIIVVDQVPTKLAPDAIKNTNMKVIHRIIAGDDRNVIAGSIGLSEIQERYLINLTVGETVVFVEHSDEPFMVQIPPIKDTFAGSKVQVTDTMLKEKMQERFYQHYPPPQRKTGPFIGCEYCDHKCYFHFMVEALVNDTKLHLSVKNALKLKGDEKINTIRSLLVPAVQALGYRDELLQITFAKSLCAFIQHLNAMPGSGPLVEKNKKILVREYKKRIPTVREPEK